MKKILFYICFSILFAGSAFSQVEFPEYKTEYSKIELSGLRITILYSDTFSVKMGASVEIEKTINGDTLAYTVMDQTGKVPKTSMIIRTNKLEYLSLHNCKLVDMRAPFKVDSLVVETASSSGELKVEAKYLSVNVGAGSQFSVSGTADYFDCAAGAGSTLNAASLKADKGEVDVRGYANMTVNIREILKQNKENGQVKNSYQ